MLLQLLLSYTRLQPGFTSKGCSCIVWGKGVAGLGGGGDPLGSEDPQTKEGPQKVQ